jgi:hypothetical protein
MSLSLAVTAAVVFVLVIVAAMGYMINKLNRS